MSTGTRRRKRNPGWHPGLGVKTIRERQGLDQEEFAALLAKASHERWDQSKVSRLETGELKMDTDRLKLIAQIQGMNYEWYLDGPKGNEAKGVYVTSRRSIAAA
jgi:transcriptional regulator with XRE-family HTH domain